MRIPEALSKACRGSPEAAAWLEGLSTAVSELSRRWEIRVGRPVDQQGGSCSWVAPAELEDGTRSMLKLGMPHMEGLHELQGLGFWAGDPTVRLMRCDVALNAMLLERCEPGRRIPETRRYFRATRFTTSFAFWLRRASRLKLPSRQPRKASRICWGRSTSSVRSKREIGPTCSCSPETRWPMSPTPARSRPSSYGDVS